MSKFVVLPAILFALMFMGAGCESENERFIPYESETAGESIRDCGMLAPSNPYSSGTGHYAGYEWGENGNYCSGNSPSFIEGCEEYEQQEMDYNNCVAQN